VKILFATAELSPLAAVGGLAQAAAGLVRELRAQGVEVEVALPDYTGLELEGEERVELDVPAWAAPASARRGRQAGAGEVTLVEVPGIARPHPYLDASGQAWLDNDARFIAFGAAVAALARTSEPDVVHLNDWHTSSAAADLHGGFPIVLSVHNLSYQGRTSQDWLARLGPNAWAFDWDWHCNPLAGAIALADSIVFVSPTYRDEVMTPSGGMGLDWRLRERADAVVGILNGIEADVWSPANDPYLPAAFSARDLAGKWSARVALLDRLGLARSPAPVAVSVTRLTEQKGIDLLLPLVAAFPGLGLRFGILGSGDAWLAEALTAAAAERADTVVFVEGYDESLSHLLVAGGDLLLMPSRFEPSGLTQMQAMSYGTLPVVTDVGGLHDTVLDLDHDPAHGTGWRAATPDVGPVHDAIERAVRGWANPSVRRPAQWRGMTTDWSWARPAARYLALYEDLTA
jgi:starch synthase